MIPDTSLFPKRAKEPLVIKDVIGGLEKKKVDERFKWTYQYNLNRAHNQLCNREVEVDKAKLRVMLNDLFHTVRADFPHKDYDRFVAGNTIVDAISKAIEQGKVLKVVE